MEKQVQHIDMRSEKPNKKICEDIGFKNYGQCVNKWARGTLAKPQGQVIWEGDPSQGTAVFGNIECDDPGSVTVSNGAFLFDKPNGLKRCEARNIRVNSYLYTFQNDSTYWIGWTTEANTDDAATVFQWKSYPGADQNYPILMKIEYGELRLFYIAPGQQWNLIWSNPIATGSSNHIALGIGTSDLESDGWIELYFNGEQQTFLDGSKRYIGRTWDSDNEPKWGIYGAEITDQATTNRVSDLIIGTTYESIVSPEDF